MVDVLFRFVLVGKNGKMEIELDHGVRRFGLLECFSIGALFLLMLCLGVPSVCCYIRGLFDSKFLLI